MSSNPCNQVHGLRGEGLVWLIGAQYACWQLTAGQQSVTRAMGAATCAAVLQPLPISHHFHGCTALLVLHFVVVNWRYIKYLALPFTFFNANHNVNQQTYSVYSLQVPCIRAHYLTCSTQISDSYYSVFSHVSALHKCTPHSTLPLSSLTVNIGRVQITLHSVRGASRPTPRMSYESIIVL